MKKIAIIILTLVLSINVFALSKAQKNAILRKAIKINRELAAVLSKIKKNSDVKKYLPEIKSVGKKFSALQKRQAKNSKELQKYVRKLGKKHPLFVKLRNSGMALISQAMRIKSIKPDGVKILKLLGRYMGGPRRGRRPIKARANPNNTRGKASSRSSK